MRGSSTRYTLRTCRLGSLTEVPQRLLTGTLLTPCPLEANMRISLKSILTEAERLGQALGEEQKRALTGGPAVAKWTGWPTPFPPRLSKTTSGAFQCRLLAYFPQAAYILSGPSLRSRVPGVTSAFRLETRRNVVRGYWRYLEGEGLSPSPTKETRPNKLRGVAKGQGPFPGGSGAWPGDVGTPYELRVGKTRGLGLTYQAWVRWVSRVDAQVRDGGASTAELTDLEQGVSVTSF